MNKSVNPSAIRSREMLTESLLTLMQKKPYQEISIKDIIFAYGNELVSQLGMLIQNKSEGVPIKHLPLIFSFGECPKDCVNLYTDVR